MYGTFMSVATILPDVYLLCASRATKRVQEALGKLCNWGPFGQ